MSSPPARPTDPPAWTTVPSRAAAARHARRHQLVLRPRCPLARGRRHHPPARSRRNDGSRGCPSSPISPAAHARPRTALRTAGATAAWTAVWMSRRPVHPACPRRAVCAIHLSHGSRPARDLDSGANSAGVEWRTSQPPLRSAQGAPCAEVVRRGCATAGGIRACARSWRRLW